MHKITIILAILGVLALVGCTGSKTDTVTEDVVPEPPQQVVCNSPYILVGTSCCLDQNDNSICDTDEAEVKPATVVEEPPQTQTPEPKPTPPPIQEVKLSTSTAIWDVFCDADTTKLKRQTTFDKYKDTLFQWNGELATISETGDEITVKECSTTFTADITIKMKSDQVKKLLDLKEGDIFTYKTRLVKFEPNTLFGTQLNGVEGEVIK